MIKIQYENTDNNQKMDVEIHEAENETAKVHFKFDPKINSETNDPCEIIATIFKLFKGGRECL